MEIRFVYITAENMQQARRIADGLVAARLAACVNIIDGMRSVYRWKGAIQQDREVVLIAKTTAGRLPELIERVKSLHSYECPCIVSLPVVDGYQPFLDWIAAEVAPED